jgi:hypothetical protein
MSLRAFWGPRNHLQAWHFVLCLIPLQSLETRLAPWHAVVSPAPHNLITDLFQSLAKMGFKLMW